MDNTFECPVFVKEGSTIRRIECVMDAIEFLEEWPIQRRGLIHEVTCETCYAAHDGRKPVDTARKAFATLARMAGILETVPQARTWMTGPKIGHYDVRREG